MLHEQPDKRGDDYVNLYREGANRAQTVVVALFVSLIIGWFSIVEAIHTDLKEYVNQDEKKELVDRRNKLLAHVQVRLREKEGENAPTVSIENVLLLATEEEARAFESLELRYSEVVRRISTIESERRFDFFGTTIPVPWIAGSAFWVFVCAFLIAFILYKRETLFSKLITAHSYYEDALSKQDLTEAPSSQKQFLRDFAGTAPFWLAPIHVIAEDDETANAKIRNEIREALGWSPFQEKLASILSGIVCALLALITIRVITIEFLITDDNNLLRRHLDVSEGLFSLLLLIDFLTVATAALIFGGITVWWFGLPLKLRTRFSRNRRHFIGSGIATTCASVVGLSLIVNWKDQVSPKTAKASRTAKSEADLTAHSVPRGFYRLVSANNDYQQRARYRENIHYIDKAGHCRTVPPNTSKQLVRVDDAREIVARIPRQEFTYAIELSVLEANLYGDPTEVRNAVELLDLACLSMIRGWAWNSRINNRISFRLLDLLYFLENANGSIDRSKYLADEINAELTLFESFDRRDHRGLKNRLAHWRGSGEKRAKNTWAFFDEHKKVQIAAKSVTF